MHAAPTSEVSGNKPRVTLSPGRRAQRMTFRFVDTQGPLRSAVLIEQCESESGPEFALAAGNMCLDMAFADEKRGNISPEAWMARARKNWAEALTGKRGYASATAGAAAMRLAVADAYEAHATQQTILSLEERRTAYENLVRVAKSQADILANTHRNSRAIGDIAGNVGEMSLDLVLERFALRNDIASWTARPSLLSQDVGVRRSKMADLRTTWDTSVLTQFDQAIPPDLTYKVQAKAKHCKGDYAGDIAEISVMTDLSLDPNPDPLQREPVPITQIATECYDELFSPQGHIADLSRQKLNMREDLLLKLLDERTL